MCIPLKKMLSMFLIITLGLMVCTPSFAANDQNSEDEHDPYADNVIETIEIGTTEFTYEYYYNDNGNRSIDITNEETGQLESLEFVVDNQGYTAVYNDSQVVGGIYPANSCPINQEGLISLQSGWVSMGPTDCFTVTWAMGTSAAIVGALIGNAIGGLVGSQIVSVVGSTVLGTLGSQTTGCTVCVDLYYMDLITAIQYMYVFGITDTTNIYHGPYTIYKNPYPYV